MDFLLEYLTQLGVSTILSFPRVFVGDYPESRYEKLAPELIAKLPNLKKIRDKLTPEQLAEVIRRERIPFDELLEMRSGRTKKYIDPTTGDFVPFTSEKTLPSNYQDITLNLDPVFGFALPNSSWAGPMWSGGRFLKPGETLSPVDLSVLPSDQIDLISRRHDIHYALIATIPDEIERDNLKKIANSIYALSLWQENDFPKEQNEVGEFYYRLVQQVIPSIISFASVYSTVTNNYANNYAALLRVYQELVQPIAGLALPLGNPRPIAPSQTFGTVQFDAPVGGLRPPEGMRPLGPANVYSPSIVRNLYLQTINTPESQLFSNPAVQDTLNLPEIERRLLRIGDLAVNNEIPIPQLNRMIDQELRELDVVFRTAPTREMPTYQDVISSESWQQLLGNTDFWKSLGIIYLISNTFSYLAERQLDRRSRDDIMFRQMILNSNIDYRRAHPLWTRLAEVVFRLDFGFSIPYNKLSNETINLYIEAIDPPIPDDPIVKAVRKYQESQDILVDSNDEVYPSDAVKPAEIETGQVNLNFSQPLIRRDEFQVLNQGFQLMKNIFMTNQSDIEAIMF